MISDKFVLDNFMRSYKYFWSLSPGIVVVVGNILGGWWGVMNLIFSLGVLAFIEWFFPEDKTNEAPAGDFIPGFILVLHVILQLLALGTLFVALAEKKFLGLQVIVACLSTGIHSGSSAIVVAHE